jgi:predicted porin
MQKKVMALAVAGALVAPAAAFAQSNVQIYGRINAGLDNYQATGASTTAAGAAGQGEVKARNRMFDQGSRLGVRGSEDLGNGLKALFVIESGLNVDTGSGLTQSGSANSSAGSLATRDSYVGLEGGFGRVTMGRQALWYGNGVVEQVTSNYVNTGDPFFSGTLGRIGAPTTRTNNAFVYTSPTFSGFNGTVYYSPNSEATTAQSSVPGSANIDTNGKIYGFTLRYTGVVNAQVDWGTIVKASGSVNNGTAGVTPAPANTQINTGANQPPNTPVANGPGNLTGLKVGVGWPYAPGGQISLVYVQLKQESANGTAGFTATGDTVQQKGWGLNWEHVFGNIQALAQYSQVGKATGCTENFNSNTQILGVQGTTCDGTKAKAYMIGARYLMSKRTAVYVTYNQIKNDANANQDYQPAGYSAVGTLAAGADPRVWAIGMMHNF